jgi:hypothetical protein
MTLSLDRRWDDCGRSVGPVLLGSDDLLEGVERDVHVSHICKILAHVSAGAIEACDQKMEMLGARHALDLAEGQAEELGCRVSERL